MASAGSASEGLEVCRKFHPEIILLDYHLPGGNGAHLFETFRRNKATSRTPILFMSAVACADDILNQIDDPDIARFLPKPVNSKDLLLNIKEILAASASSPRPPE